MHTFTRGVVGAGVALASIIVITGCSVPSTPTAEVSASTAPTGTPAPTEAATTVDFGSTPDTTGRLACSTALPDDLVAALVPGLRAVDTLTDSAHIAGSEAFVPGAGGILCDRSNGVAPLDDHVPGRAGETLFEGVRLSVLPDARAALAEHNEYNGGGTPTTCGASDSARVYCTADVIAGSAWVHLASTRLQDDADATAEQAQPAFDALLSAVVRQVSGSPLGTTSDGTTTDDGSITTCDAGNVNAVTTTELAVGPFVNSSTAPEADDFARNRVGGASCVFIGTAGSYPTADALFTQVPDAGWIVQRRLAAGTVARAERLDVDGLGARDAAWRTCDDDACTVDVVHDGDWTHYVLYRRAAPDASGAIARWVASSFDS